MLGYGPLDLLWLDGGWVRPAGTLTEETLPWIGKNQWVQDIDMPAIAAMARKHHPDLLIVDRTVHGEFENYRTPEQQVPASKPDYPWESCITLGDSWYHTGPSERYKTTDWAIHTLIRIVAKGGNFLLGIGPDKSGDLPLEAYNRLEAIGKWMGIHGTSIYNSTPLPPYEKGDFCFTQTKDGSTRHAFYLKPEGKALPETLELPGDFLGNQKSVFLIGFEERLKVRTENGKQLIELPKALFQKSGEMPAIVFYIKN